MARYLRVLAILRPTILRLPPVGCLFGEPWGQPLFEHLKELRGHAHVSEAWYVSLIEFLHDVGVGPPVLSLLDPWLDPTGVSSLGVRCWWCWCLASKMKQWIEHELL